MKTQSKRSTLGQFAGYSAIYVVFLLKFLSELLFAIPLYNFIDRFAIATLVLALIGNSRKDRRFYLQFLIHSVSLILFEGFKWCLINIYKEKLVVFKLL